MFGDAESVVDGGVASGRKQAGRGANFGGGHTGVGLHCLGAVLCARHEFAPQRVIDGLATLGYECFVNKSFGDNYMCKRVDEGHVGAGSQLEEVR